MVNNKTNDVFSIQTINLTKRFAKKKHRGVFGFLRRNQSKNGQKENNDVTVALNKVNIKIRPGELFGLLGPNGSGKTTMIKCLSTILIPDEGTATVNGFDISKETSMVRASLGMVVGGERTLYWKLTARDNLMYFSSLYKMQRRHAKKRVEELLETFKLSDRADERLEDYSTGMRQKVAIARAILHDPPILLLDEPTLGLDPSFARQIRRQIRELSEKQGKTVLLTTHYMDEADQLCDRVAFINNGNIVAVDTPNRLKAMVKEKELVEISVISPPVGIEKHIRSLLPDAEVIKLIPGDDSEGTPSRIKIIGGTPEEHMGTIIDALRQKNVRISGLNVGVPTLEDVFIKLTGAKLSEGGMR
ncbi:ABC transporter ATP-binding protein [Candidatus Bathyarchaeota archaeon]|nr:ABC transporter ATP-binding protein [Candidatus Bathyarchaeota archaeon]